MFHRKSTKESQRAAFAAADTTVPRRPAAMHPALPTPKNGGTSTTESRTARPPLKQIAPSMTGSGSTVSKKPSSLPRSTSGRSTQRLDALASSRAFALHASTQITPEQSRSGSVDVPLVYDYNADKPPSSHLYSQRRPSPPQVLSDRNTTTSAMDMEPDTLLGIALPQRRTSNKYQTLPPRLIPELQALGTQQHKPKYYPAPSFSTVSSPSTGFTESPAQWSASTTTTTPISWPSSSPATVQTSGLSDRKSKTVPQPTAPHSRLPKLPMIAHAESQSRQLPPAGIERGAGSVNEKRSRRKPIVDKPAPTPPSRKSSSQRSTSRGNKSGASSIDETLSRGGHPAVASSSAIDPSPLASRNHQKVDRIGESLRRAPTDGVHASLQRSIGPAPSRPSREGTTDLGESRPTVGNAQQAGHNDQHRRLLDSAFDEPLSHQIPTDQPQRNVSESSLPDSAKPKRSPSKLGKLARLGLFTRRGNTPSSDVDKSPNKLQRRGPAAGTGHEGYGKYGRRSRKTSNGSSEASSDSEQSVSSVRRTPLVGTGRKSSISSSRHNRSSQSDLDEFAASRLKPVIMRGGSQTSVPQRSDSSGARTQMSTPEPLFIQRPSTAPAVGDLPMYDRPRLRSPRGKISRSREQLSDEPSHIPSLALRRSQKFGTGHLAFPMPTPIYTDDLVAPTQITSHDTSWSSLVPASAAPSSSGTETYRIDPSLLKSNDKRFKRQWWNPFRRRNTPVISPDLAEGQLRKQPEMAVSIATGPAPRSFPYYAMMESESDNNTTGHNIGDFLSEAVQSDPQSPALRAVHREPVRKTDSVLLPSAPPWSDQGYQSESWPQDKNAQLSTEQLVKQPRLPRVGRIPKVVSRAERQHTPSRRSFSQPFAKQPGSETPPLGSPQHFDGTTERPHLEIHTDLRPSRPFSEAISVSSKPASALAVVPPPQSTAAPQYAVDLPSKHGSDISASSSSDGMISVMGPPLFPTQRERELKSRMPGVRIPSIHPGEDEIWNEYDDFIDQVMSPSRSPKMKPRTPADRPPEPTVTSPPVGNINQRPSSKGKMRIPEPRRAVLDLPLPGAHMGSARVLSPLPLSDKDNIDENRLRRSRIVSALHSSVDPTSPFSMRYFLNEYDAQGQDIFGLPDQHTTSTTAQMAPIAPTSAKVFGDASHTEHTQRENALLLDSVARSKNPFRESELQYASLEVARWLSFGRVLFSPAHEEIHVLPERNVLVVDGLGNEDWSIYCAVTYEAKGAIVYDLKEASRYKLPKDSQYLPANLRRAPVTSLSERFPFHSAFFSAIVLRFLPSTSEATMRNIVSECRRTLVPGGHLEIMILNIDIVNMGVQTRRAVRELKMTMATADPEVSLKPGIDNFQNILGGRGFVGLNRCVVGVPVVGRPSGSIDSSSSSRSSAGSSGYGRRTSGDLARPSSYSRSHNFSLNELVADHSEKADAKIGRMVSTCARSWWVHCFEAAVIPDGDLSRSIFADKRVLQECKSRASSFKLLIAYAQRPVFETRRRTMSEPGSGNLATASPSRRNK